MNRSKTIGECGAIVFAVILFLSHPACAAPVTADAAANAVRGWLHHDRRPLGSALSARVKSTQAVKNAAGEVLYYVVQLDPSGFVILPADDLAGPIIAFSAAGSFDASSTGPLEIMVNRDLPRRMARARAGGAPAASAAQSHRKWHAFLAGSPNPPPDSEENSNIVVVSQVWVAPFVQTLWNQQSDVSLSNACYNYYTPPFLAGTVGNDPCGCVATCMAQVMYYFQYPNTGVGTNSFTITNTGVSQMTRLLGGNGAGGVYQWSQMPLSPNNPTTAQAIAIGSLIHDAGATVHMAYTPTGSEAYTYLSQQALTNTFMFKNAAYYENDGSGISGSNLLNMINPNLDARLPVVLAIEPDGGHCALCDGYGYSASTLFHHLNMGWGGNDDIWYALPEIDTPDVGVFTTVVACVYNIYTNNTGQIISGQVTDPTGAPVAGATMTAVRTNAGGGTYTATTDTNGIYALAHIPAASGYSLTVSNAGDSTATGNYSTGTSVYNALPSGNVWGANFVLSPPLLAIPETGFASIGPVGGAFSVIAQTYTLTNTSASSLNWTLSNTNNWLGVTAAAGTLAALAATNLTISLNAAATNLAAGTYAGSIWITNLNNSRAQQLQFSLTVATADYPIAVTGFNLDVVVENAAAGGNTYNYADVFDSNCDFFSPAGPVCFYEAGLTAFDYFGGTAVLGLPQSGLFTSLVDNTTTFQFAPYNNSNVLYLTSASNSASLTLNTPMACKSLSVLAASAQGGGNGTLVIHFADGTSSSAIAFNATHYLTTNTPSPGAALTNFGLLITGDFNEYGSVDNDSVFPTLYQTTINLQTLGLSARPITSVTFTRPNGAGTTANTVTGVFALSGTASPLTNSPVSFVTSPGALSFSGGQFTMQLTNLTGQGPVVIFASTNLMQWIPIYTNPSGYGTFLFTDSNAAAYPQRFYGASTP